MRQFRQTPKGFCHTVKSRKLSASTSSVHIRRKVRKIPREKSQPKDTVLKKRSLQQTQSALNNSWKTTPSGTRDRVNILNHSSAEIAVGTNWSARRSIKAGAVIRDYGSWSSLFYKALRHRLKSENNLYLFKVFLWKWHVKENRNRNPCSESTSKEEQFEFLTLPLQGQIWSSKRNWKIVKYIPLLGINTMKLFHLLHWVGRTDIIIIIINPANIARVSN